MKCIIVDDNRMARKALRQLISNFEFLELKGEFSSSVEAYNYLQANDTDLLLLDVEMPGMTGIELLKNLDKRPIVILVTGKKNYAVEAYELSVADYIVKPVTLARFGKAVTRAHELFEAKKAEGPQTDKDYIFIRSDSILTKVNSSRIIYVHCSGDHVYIQTPEKKLTVNTTLKSMQERLPGNKFCRLNNSYLVAVDKIDYVQDNTAHVGKFNLPIGKQYKEDLMKRLNLVQ
jgi:two-component system LytT family response regulator